jgi:hypothetical protein
MRRLLVSSKDFIGLCPLSAQEGDEFWILAGARLPFILRKAPEGEYDLIGEAYLYGFMHGEYFASDGHSNFEMVVLR